MYNWDYNLESSDRNRYFDIVLFVAAAVSAILLYLIFHPQIEQINRNSPILINFFFGASLAVGFLYGVKITERAMKPSEERSPLKRSLVKIFLFFFVIGGLFSSVSFALNGGSVMPLSSIFEDGLDAWIIDYVSQNGGATFLIVTSITLMASATKRIVGLGGTTNKIVTFVSTFTFFAMLSLSFSQSNPTNSEVYLYTFYQAGIVGGALFTMNKLTKNLNFWEDYSNGYL